jgi:hypothetical protein
VVDGVEPRLTRTLVNLSFLGWVLVLRWKGVCEQLDNSLVSCKLLIVAYPTNYLLCGWQSRALGELLECFLLSGPGEVVTTSCC